MYTYDPSRVTLSWNGIRIFGFAPDTFITIKKDSESFKKTRGAQGEGCRVRMNDNGGSIVFRLMKESPCNRLLQDALTADENGLGAPAPAFMLDGNSATTQAESSESWLMKQPDAEYGTDAGTREWTIDCNDLFVVEGGQ